MESENLSRRKPEEFVGPPEQFTFVHESGRESTVQVRGKELIGKGFWGNIYRAQANVLNENDPEHSRVHTVVLKSFDTDVYKEHGADAHLRAQYAVRAYEETKRAGVRTWATYRLEKERPIILMTDGGQSGTIISASNPIGPDYAKNWSRDKDNVLQQPITDIVNLEAALKDAIKETKKAQENGVRLPEDAWFIRIKSEPNSSISIEFFVGDFDSVFWDGWASDNVERLGDTATTFIQELWQSGSISMEQWVEYKKRISDCVKNSTRLQSRP